MLRGGASDFVFHKYTNFHGQLCYIKKVVVRSSRLLAEFVVTTLEIESVKRKLFLYFHAPRISQVISRLSNLPVLKMRSTLFCAERTYVGLSLVGSVNNG